MQDVAQQLLTGGTVIDVVSGTAAPADVLIDGNRSPRWGGRTISGRSRSATKVDVSGKTILPGLSNSHVHLGWSGMGWDGGPMGILRTQALDDSDGINGIKAVANLRKSLKVGLTSLRDLGMNNSGFDAKNALEERDGEGAAVGDRRQGDHVHRWPHLVVRPSGGRARRRARGGP